MNTDATGRSQPARTCTDCGAELPKDGPQALCSRCALAGALAMGSRTVVIGDPASTAPMEGLSVSGAPTRFGDYELLGEVSRGGMGVVYQAQQISLGRIVAVKMILGGLSGDKKFVERFRTEASAAAVLQHPNIVSVHEVGFHQGQHYFSMDYVEGQNLAQFVGQQPLPPLRAARYLKQIAEAIHFAHGKGILHRDLKPSNILIDTQDQPRVTDFGLAKKLDGESSLTLTGQILGSPSFMPPEQAGGISGKVGRASDVYALGGILYYLLVARAPFHGETLEATLHQVLNKDPLSPRLLNSSVPLDLETICLKCLQKEPGRRYATAQDLADELGRFLRQEPIHARPVGHVEKVWRWARRHPAVASLSAATLMLLLAVAIGAPIAAARIADGRAQARSKAKELEENLYFNRIALAHREVEANKPAHALTLLELCPEPLRGWEWNYLHRQCHLPPATPVKASGRIQSFALNGNSIAVIAGNDLQLWELGPSGTPEFRTTLESAPRPILPAAPDSVAFSPDGNYLASISTNHTIKLWEISQYKLLKTLRGPTNFITGILFHPNGKELAGTTYENTIWVWDLATGRELEVLKQREDGGRANRLAYSPDGHLLAAGSYGQGIIRVWNTTTRKPVFDLAGHLGPTGSLAFSPDSRMLASASSDDPAIRLWDMTTGLSAGTLDGLTVPTLVVFHPSGSRLIASSTDHEIKLWDVAGHREVIGLSGQTDVPMAAFTGDGSQIVSADTDGTLRVLDASPWTKASGATSMTLTGHVGTISALAFGRDGSRLYSACLRGSGMAWDWRHRSVVGHMEALFDVAVSSDGKFVVTSGGNLNNGTLHVKILDSNSLKEVFSVSAESELFSAALSLSNDLLAVGTAKGELRIWDWRKSHDPIVLSDGSDSVTYVRFSPDGRQLAYLDYLGSVRVRPSAALSEASKKQTLLTGIVGRDWPRMSFSPDGKTIATGNGSHDLVVLDAASGALQHRLSGHGGVVHAVAFSPNGRWLATGGADSTVRLWEAQTGKLVGTFAEHHGTVFALAFSPDSRNLASGGQDHTIKIWHLDQE